MAEAKGKKKGPKKEKKNVPHALATVQASFNNTIVSITDPMGSVVAWSSAGRIGFKGSRKGTPFAAQLAAGNAAQLAQEHGVRSLDVRVKGPGAGRGAIRACGGGSRHPLHQDAHPHNGCRPRKLGASQGSLRNQGSRETPRFSRWDQASHRQGSRQDSPAPSPRPPSKALGRGPAVRAGRPSGFRLTGRDEGRIAVTGSAYVRIPLIVTAVLCRLCRREAMKLFLKGDRCFTNKCAIERRNFPPGQHGKRRSKILGYGIQLREKQKLKRFYGLLETQFRLTFEAAERMRGVTGENLLSLLERRLDNVVHRLGFAASRAQARQLVRHGHVRVNGKKVNIPSYLVDAGATVASRKSQKNPLIAGAVRTAMGRGVPAWLELNARDFTGKVLSRPKREHVPLVINEKLIVELYSK
jgi:small subunit ribosomal protein S4